MKKLLLGVFLSLGPRFAFAGVAYSLTPQPSPQSISSMTLAVAGSVSVCQSTGAAGPAGCNLYLNGQYGNAGIGAAASTSQLSVLGTGAPGASYTLDVSTAAGAHDLTVSTMGAVSVANNLNVSGTSQYSLSTASGASIGYEVVTPTVTASAGYFPSVLQTPTASCSFGLTTDSSGRVNGCGIGEVLTTLVSSQDVTNVSTVTFSNLTSSTSYIVYGSGFAVGASLRMQLLVNGLNTATYNEVDQAINSGGTGGLNTTSGYCVQIISTGGGGTNITQNTVFSFGPFVVDEYNNTVSMQGTGFGFVSSTIPSLSSSGGSFPLPTGTHLSSLVIHGAENNCNSSSNINTNENFNGHFEIWKKMSHL